MNDFLYLNNLYDYYQPLLTKKQQQYFEDYYFQNLSLSEMAENYHISRNAIYGQLKLVEKKLKDYEEKLQLYKKREQIKDLIHKKIDSSLESQILELL